MRRFALLDILLLCCVPLAVGQVRVSQDVLSLPATDEGAPNENPPFDLFSTRNFNYPYTLREGVQNTESVHAFRALHLENEYLKCTILPDLGGHIYTCIDKINGKPLFYANPSIKKALIGYRGAWAAFGVEFNFPVSHNWVSLSPVDWAYSSAPDGSASVTVGNRDRVYGMEWTVQIILRPGSTVLEEDVTLSNHSDLRHRFYWWSNAGIEVWDDSRIEYPMQFTASHGFKDIDTWPIDSSGKDLSLISNQTSGWVSRFVYGSREPFMGIYNPHADAGVVHYANYAELPAKKIWSWGMDKDGLEWRKTLSDNNSAYVEVQGGLFRNQETYAFLEPQQTLHFSEFWMPVREIGSISRANLQGVVSLTRTPQLDGKITLAAAFNANQKIPSATIKILDGTKNIYKETVSLNPARTWLHKIANLPANTKYTFVLMNAQGKTLLQHTEDTYDWTPRDEVKTGPQPGFQPSAPEAWTDGDFLSDGTSKELQGDLLGAWNSYQTGLAKFPASFELLKAAGRLAVGLLRYDEALKLLSQAEARATWDAEIHYYRGIAASALGQMREAQSDFEAAHRDPAFRTAGAVKLAELLAQQHDSAGALKILHDSCPSATGDLRCLEETVALKRAAGDRSHARQLARKTLAHNPTSSFLRNEISKLDSTATSGLSAPSLNRHLATDSSRILNLVIEYNLLGLYANSLDLLTRRYPTVAPDESEPGAIHPANDPLLAYYRGFCRQKLGQSAAADFAAAAKMPVLYVFPNEAETIPVLQAALAANPSDASAHFLLGSLWFSRGIVDPALDEWRRAESLNPRIPALHASLGRALLEIKKQPAEAAAVFQRGLAADPLNPALYTGLDEAMRQSGQSPAQRVAMLQRFPDQDKMPAAVVRALVFALREDGRSKEADAVLAQHFMPRKEGEEPLQPTSNPK
jgi:tetratricopeptide (TPR) repeat protein